MLTGCASPNTVVHIWQNEDFTKQLTNVYIFVSVLLKFDNIA